jgi:hypothetical protein
MSVPSAPNIKYQPLATSGALEFAWNPPSQPNGTIGGYRLIVAAGISNEFDSSARYYKQTGLVNGTWYYPTLEASNENGYGPPAEFTPFQPGTKPSPPTWITAQPIIPSSILVRWSNAPLTQPQPNADVYWYSLYLKNAQTGALVNKYTADGQEQPIFYMTQNQTDTGPLNPTLTYNVEAYSVSCPGWSTPITASTIGFIRQNSLLLYYNSATASSTTSNWFKTGGTNGASTFVSYCNLVPTTCRFNTAGNGLLMTSTFFVADNSNNPGSFTSGFTLSTWFRRTTSGIPNVASSRVGILLQQGAATATRTGPELLVAGQGIYASFRQDIAPNTGTYSASTINTINNTWINVAFTLTRSTTTGLSTQTLIYNGYSNGSLFNSTIWTNINSNVFPRTTTGTGTSLYMFGTQSDASNNFLRGELGEVLLYNRALTSNEIFSNYNFTKFQYGL